tara:strand:+ start:1249 stop:1599 length:351 start_codon:yes stop_codon:yes gene_type:complete
MKYRVTPFCLSQSIAMSDPMATFSHEDRHTVQALSDYEERPALEFGADDADAACERTWATYQNIDESRQCPDGGRSLMVGDMVRVECAGTVTWWICCSVGWARTVEPTSEAQRIEK